MVCDGPHYVTISGWGSESNFGLVSVPTWSDATGAAQPWLQLYDVAYSSVSNSAARHKQVCGQKRQLDREEPQQQLPNRAGIEQTKSSPPPLQVSGTTGIRRERRASMDFSSSYKFCLQLSCRGLLWPHKRLCVEVCSGVVGQATWGARCRVATGTCAIKGQKHLGGGSSLACLGVAGAAQPLAHGIPQRERRGSTVSMG